MPPPEDEHQPPDDAPTRTSSYLGGVLPQARRPAKQLCHATARNREPILNVLRALVPDRGRILEVASGTGQHVVAFAAAYPGVTWFPSDPHLQARASIAAWVADDGLGNVAAAMDIDVTLPDWPRVAGQAVDGIVCINLLHVAPWAASAGLMAGAARLLTAPGFLYVYGPFLRHGGYTSDNDRVFDRQVRGIDASWGLRDVDDVAACARESGFNLDHSIAMPANNLSLVFRRPS